ncbi:MAG: hypothetical protein HDR32_03995 [Treponema sp.]|nr:hypothetical protein [Treponema sp.]
MMKKTTRIAALLAATALLFGAIGCDDGGSSGGNGGDGEDDGNNNNGDAVTYVWDFATPDLAALATETSTDENTSGKPKIPAESYYESTPAGLTLTLPAGGVFNKIDATTSNSKVSGIGASKGAIEPSKGSDLTVKVKGPFTAVMLCGANSDSDKTDRYAYIKADGEEVAAPSKDNNTLKGSGEALTYAYEGTDEVTLAFGVSSGYVRIYDIKITTENGDGDGKTAGEVTSSASFEAQSTTVANNEETLGLTGATLAIDEADQAVVAAEFDETKANIKVTSKSAGTATITVKDESGEKTATIRATVTGAGKITTTVTKYTAPTAPGAATISFNANDENPFAKPTVDGVFSDVKTEFGEYSIGSFWTIFTSSDQSIKSATLTPSSTTNSKLGDYELSSDKVTMKGWLLSTESSDSSNGLTASDKGTEIASTTYTFTLAKKAAVTASQVAFNGQSGNVNGQISILDASDTEKASATGVVASKEDNDAAITDAVTLEAGTYTLKFAWVTSKANAQIKKWNCGVEKFTLTATPAE